MIPSNKRRIVLVVCAVAITLLVIIFGSMNTASEENIPTKTAPTKTSAPLTTEERQTAAQETTSAVFSMVMADITEQLGEEQANATVINSATLEEDADGKPAKVAIISASSIDTSFDYLKSIENLKSAFNTLNSENGTKWVTTVSEDGTFDKADGILKAIKIYDESENPENPALVEVSYMEYDKEGVLSYEIYISSVVY